ncbi:MAG: T9SS type A sorting domain-containing protein [Bacteroidota bacterium]|nr:T9SS type A sorting domain-containing protein [Bacteroidota bacterium]
MKTLILVVFFSFFAASIYGQGSCCGQGQSGSCKAGSVQKQACQKSDMSACAGQCTRLSSAKIGPGARCPALMPDTCGMFSDKIMHDGMMRVTGPMYCQDSMNFSVSSTRPMPFNCMMGDTVWAEVCLKAHDGRLHQTTVYYGTSQGTLSFDVAMQAAGTSGVQTVSDPAITMTLYPNPTSDKLIVNLSASPLTPMKIEIADLRGTVLSSQTVLETRELSLDISTLASGTYHVVLLSNGGTMLDAQTFVVLR